MIKAGLTPVVAVMAVLAAVAVTPFMRVIGTVAIDAGSGEFFGFLAGQVACTAGNLVVGTAELEIGCVVIEFYRRPFGAAVAAFALASKTTAMDIIAAMAGDTLHRGILVALVRVACRAQNLVMGAPEREVGGVVIKLPLAPTGRAVTISALLTEFTLVYILLAVTVDALARCLAPGLAFRVTGDALGTAMGTVEDEVCLVVIEQFSIEQHNIGVTPLVIGMADATGGITYLRGTSVISRAGLYISGDLVVAVKTEIGLSRLAETLMATGAFVFILGVPLDHLARHQQCLDVGSSRRKCDRTHHQRHPCLAINTCERQRHGRFQTEASSEKTADG